MARGQRRKPPAAWWRCPRCNALVPTRYHTCGDCGAERVSWEQAFIERAKRVFPGSREL